MNNQYENLPYQLRSLSRFCCWRYEKRTGKNTKVPYNPVTKRRANRPDMFNDFNTAVMAVNNYNGIGFLVGHNICAIDLDDCFDSTGNLKYIAQSIVDEFSDCYIEYSPSGRGLHIYFKAVDFTYEKIKYYINNQKLGVEVYVSDVTNRFMTVTSCVYCDGDVLEKTDVLQSKLDKYIPDLALCSMLAFWCGRNKNKIDRIFRQSGIMRNKWKRTQSGSTYGMIPLVKQFQLLQKCIDLVVNTHQLRMTYHKNGLPC
jgi:putative DNA primase/helicase